MVTAVLARVQGTGKWVHVEGQQISHRKAITMPESKKIAFVIAPEGTESVELTDPWDAVKDAGHQPVLVSTEAGEAQLFNHLDRADTVPVDTPSYRMRRSTTSTRSSSRAAWPTRTPCGSSRTR